jgi:protein-S-isoprenylcysteine O-methyltransferase Ste14
LTQQDPDSFVRAGAWLFKHRTSLPIPIALALLVVPPTSSYPAIAWVGGALVASGEAVRLLAVRQIGAISRTRSDRLGPLVAAGPFRWVRNPLYIGNIAIWCGFALSAQLPWLAPPILVVLGLGYHAIVRWEERLLDARLGGTYREYAARVPRWVPRLSRDSGTPGAEVARQGFTWRETFFSERGTLIAIAAGYLLLGLKSEL